MGMIDFHGMPLGMQKQAQGAYAWGGGGLGNLSGILNPQKPTPLAQPAVPAVTPQVQIPQTLSQGQGMSLSDVLNGPVLGSPTTASPQMPQAQLPNPAAPQQNYQAYAQAQMQQARAGMTPSSVGGYL